MSESSLPPFGMEQRLPIVVGNSCAGMDSSIDARPADFCPSTEPFEGRGLGKAETSETKPVLASRLLFLLRQHRNMTPMAAMTTQDDRLCG
jgi:hypothetical protein